ncbi:Cysteine-rich RLK 29, putative [Theobroma cacao]|uniref:Cysteine-rich RLK 29, putative n=1 Tax=Theobroma cacao TaxID=3641 RepID=A0A061GGA1_THECC|nr:Cysteine-rich RLK 29, putative [Theobroma cacao]
MDCSRQFFFSSLIVTFLLSLTVAQQQLVNYFCLDTSGSFTRSSTYEANLNRVLSSFSSNTANDYGFYNISSGQGSEGANAIALCRGDVNSGGCLDCINNAATDLRNLCSNEKEAIIWYENCLLRYTNRSIFGVAETNPSFYMWNVNNVTDLDAFNQALIALMDNLSTNASSGTSLRKFATGSAEVTAAQTIYALVQCTPDLTRPACSSCLSQAIALLPSCCNSKQGGMVFGPSCNLRFDIKRFYNLATADAPLPPSSAPQSPPSPPSSKRTRGTVSGLFCFVSLIGYSQNSSFCLGPVSFEKTGEEGFSKLINERILSCPFADAIARVVPKFTISALVREVHFLNFAGKMSNSYRTIIIITVPAAAFAVLLISSCIFFLRVKKSKAKAEKSLQYDFSTIRAATDDFSDTNKLGQGGFGTVYKGTIASGELIAVKRLTTDSGQGDLEFKNEVQLVAKLQHKNLVRLQGFCLEGNERLLIYEFVPNASLDQFLFDPVRRAYLDWERRHKIIGGIAQGLLYLHEDSRLQIIHCNLKASNILLDAELNPKISDFGMGRLCALDQTQSVTSRIEGTNGYMAPEYALHGQFSIKSDVFSFGVLLLEILCGQKNSAFCVGENVEDLLSYAWRIWKDGTALKLVDPILGEASRTQVTRCIHIGLLCVQENAAQRPNMASVVLMLTSDSVTVPLPSEPAFFVHSNTRKT